MAGTIDFGLLKPELAGSFAAGYRGAEQARQQTEMNQIKLDQLKQDRAMLTQLQDQLRAAGKDPDPVKIFDALIQSGNPDYVMKGIEGRRRLSELQRAEKLLGIELGGAPAPANALAAAAPIAPAPTNALAPTMAPAAQTPANALAAAPTAAAPSAAPVNAMVAPAPQEDRAQELRKKILALRSVDDPRLKAMSEVYEAELKELTKPQVVGAGATVFAGGKPIYTAPAAKPAPTELEKLIAARDALAPGDPRRATYDAAITKASTHAPAATTNVAVSTGKSYGESLGAGLAKADLDMREAALKAPNQAQTADRILSLLNEGKVYTGRGANMALQLAKGLNMTGATDIESAANTETLISSMGQATLDAIKGSGLGTGQGFTEKDKQFLQQIAGGEITLEPSAIRRLAELQNKAAKASVAKWNTRKKSIPKDALTATGLSEEKIELPTSRSAPATGAATSGPTVSNW